MKFLSHLYRLATPAAQALQDAGGGASPDVSSDLHRSIWEEPAATGWFVGPDAQEPVARWTDASQTEVSPQEPFASLSAATPASARPTYAQKNSGGATETDYYDFQGGSLVEERGGGSLSWRNENPGNILFEDQRAAIGAYHSPNGYTYAIFPDYAVGVEAAVHLLESSSYAGAGLSVNAAMERWTGLASGSAALQNYDHIVDAALRLPGSTALNSLSQTEYVRLVEHGIQRAEGWIVGVDDRLG